jgi:NTE family protein
MNRPAFYYPLLTLMLVSACSAAAEQCLREPVTDRPTIGLVLGGGGARGAAHIGVLQLLQELHVPVDYIAGTSMGSLVGGLYATGMTPQQLQTTVEDINFAALFKDATARQDEPFRRKRDDDLALFGPKLGIGDKSQLLPAGAIHGQKISFLFETLTSERVQTNNFDELPIPYRAVAADVVTGVPVVMGDGDMSVAMRSSMSVPGVFDPVERGPYLLVDGGIANNLPIDVVRAMGADIVIAIDVGTPLATREQLKSLLDLTGQMSGLLVVRNSAAQIATLKDTDILITPALGADITSASFDKAGEAIPIGYAAANAARDRLAQLSISDAAYVEHRRHIEACVSSPPPIQFVRLDNRSRFDDSVIEERLHIPLGEPLDTVALQQDLDQVYALGFLDLARYSLIEENGQTGVLISVDQDVRGTQFIEWGIDVFGNDEGTAYNLRIGYLNTAVDKYGSELRVLGQAGETPALGVGLYKAVDPALHIIVLPRVWYERAHLNTYDDGGHQTGAYRVDDWGGEFILGREFGRAAFLGAGVRRYKGKADLTVGEADLSEPHFDGGEWLANFQYDRVDNRYMPSTGSTGVLTYLRSEQSLGADAHFTQIMSNWFTAWSTGQHTLIGGFRYNTTLHNDAPVYALFRLGGLFNLSGLQEDELVGQNSGMVLASYRYHFGGAGLFPAYIGVSAEYGNATQHPQDVFDNGIMNGSLYFGYISPLGPLYWGLGFAEDGRRSYFLRLGNVLGRTRVGR